MKHDMKRLKLLLAAFTLLLFVSATPDKTTTIFIIGDSTAANKDISGGKQERGWGMVLQCYFDDNIIVDNRALNGRSSLSFINEGHWDKVLQSMKPGDYVIIQFGHNDEKPRPTGIPTQAPPSTITWRSMCVRPANMAASPC